MSDQEHFLSSGEPSPHFPEKQLENGGCLTGHESKYTKNLSCSYRWQSIERSRSHRKPIYNRNFSEATLKKIAAERDPKQRVAADRISTSAYYSKDKKTGKWSRLNPPNYATRLMLPKEPGDWWVEGPLRPGVKDAAGKTVKPGTNFVSATVPYWNNAHHVIPKGTFNQVINAIAEDGGERADEVRDLVVKSLLKARYNVNHYKNMILLPQDKEVGQLFALPRHLVLEDETVIVEEGSPKFDHRKYGDVVRMRLKDVIDKYKRACDKALQKDCKTEFIKLSKTQLEKLSRDCYAEITEHARKGSKATNPLRPGEALSALKVVRRFKRDAIAGMPY